MQFDLTLDVTAPVDIGDGLSLAGLKALLAQLLSKGLLKQERLIADLREENARLKGVKGRPRMKPSGMEKASGAADAGASRQSTMARGRPHPRVSVDEEVVEAQVPPGSRFKGYEGYVVQDVVLRAGAWCAIAASAG